MSQRPISLSIPFAPVIALAIAGTSGVEAGSRIIRGMPAVIEDAPWHLLFDMGGHCGASWIGGRWALTAAHCVEDNRQGGKVHAGITRTSEAQSSNAVAVKRYIVHPQYATRDWDIALLELAADITATKARPIRLVSPQDAAAGLTAAGREARLTGWGMNESDDFPDVLHRLDAKISSRVYADWNLSFAGPAGGQPQGSCSGDSGGPLAVKDATGTVWLQAGIVHAGIGECGENPGIYTKVSMFYEWIQQTTGGATDLGGPRPPEVPRLASPRTPARTDAGILFGLDGRRRAPGATGHPPVYLIRRE